MINTTHRKSGKEISLLGFGCMRFPKLYENKEDIDYKKSEEMIDYAYNHGVNYFDTAWVYHAGLSELFIGEALKKYPRDSFYLATKFPGWERQAQNPDGAKKIFEEQLKKCQVEYFDFYLLHSINSEKDYIDWYKNSGVLNYLISEKKNGRIKNLGFSFHGPVPLMELVAKDYDWDFAQAQINYLDWDTKNAKQLYNILEKHNIQCIVMEPVRGGTLATLCDESVKIFKNAEPNMSIASWAIRYVASLPNVLTILSGMSTMEQVIDNVETLSSYKPLTESDQSTIQKALEAFLKKDTIPCTACRYCMDCPFGVDIPAIFKIYNKFAAMGKLPIYAENYHEELVKNSVAFAKEYNTLAPEHQAHNCTKCMSCVKSCPQNIDIPLYLEKIAKMVSELKLS
ncbi:MAG: aldo/keto reductase [Bacillota bacterium]|nr:aldo/keto reductase [Bacillota bacterium]